MNVAIVAVIQLYDTGMQYKCSIVESMQSDFVVIHTVVLNVLPSVVPSTSECAVLQH